MHVGCYEKIGRSTTVTQRCETARYHHASAREELPWLLPRAAHPRVGVGQAHLEYTRDREEEEDHTGVQR
jgi:hypothetical protein